jgi:hypothetical protein
MTGLPHEELTDFLPQRLALHELIVRVTAEVVVVEGDKEEDFGHNFRRIARKIHDEYLIPCLPAIAAAHAELRRDADRLTRKLIGQALGPPPAPARIGLLSNLFPRSQHAAEGRESATARDYRVVSGFKTAGLSASDPLERAVLKSLYRLLGAVLARHGRLGAYLGILIPLVGRHVGNTYGSKVIGCQIGELINRAVTEQGYARVPNRQEPVLISLKGASAAGKSSLRPMLKRLLHEQRMEADGYVTISPDVWRRLLLDYERLGPARKYVGHLTSREVIVIDGKLDRYIRDKARRDNALPHLLVDRFRFDSFSGEQVARVLHNTYAKHVDTIYMYFLVTPPEDTVERGWLRALERGRYKAVEEFLAHSVEAYVGMPKILFKWLAYRRPAYRYAFLDNTVPKGSFPHTIASGSQDELTILDPLALVDIERYQKVNIHAASRNEVYPSADMLTVRKNSGFLKELLRRVPKVRFADGETIYLLVDQGAVSVVNAATLARVLSDRRMLDLFAEIVPDALSQPRAAALPSGG